MSQSLKKRICSALPVCLAACGCTIVLLAVVYALRGIWPFGADNVAYVDTAQFYTPSYYKLWDALHGSASFDLHWTTGLAEGASIGVKDLLDPAIYVFLLVAREHILEGLSLYLAAKMVLVAAVTGGVISLRFPGLDSVWKVLFTLLYTFSGFVLQYYANFSWLEVTAAFPLLLFALERLLRTGKYVPYTVMYIWFLWQSVYFTYMITVYILLFSFGYLVFVLPKDQRGDRAFRLGVSTAAAYGLCAYFWLKSSSSLAGTSRFQSNLDSGLMAGMTTWNIPYTRHTVLMLLGMALVMAVFVRELHDRKLLDSERRQRWNGAARMLIFMAAALAIPMVFTNIDTVWHFGQYNFFPMRYGFVVPATLIAFAGAALEARAAEPVSAVPNAARDRHPLLWRLLLILWGAILVQIFLFQIDPLFQKYGSVFLNTIGRKAYGRYMLALIAGGAIFTALYLGLLRSRHPRIAAWAISAAVLLQLGTNAWGLLAPDDNHVYTHEYDPAYIETSDELYAYLSRQNLPALTRFKNVDNSLNAGYPAIAGVQALSSVNSSNSTAKLGVFRELGYSVNYFRVLDTGGTVFSDMLLGVDYILSQRALDTSLYVPALTVGDTQIATARYPGVKGLMFDGGALDDYLAYETLPDRLNALYRAFTDTDDTLAAAVKPVVKTDGEGLRTYTLSCQLDESSFLYLSADGVMMNITAGGQGVAVPTYLNLRNTVYPATFNSNLLYLGRFDGPAEIQFSSASALTADDLTVVALSAAALDRFYDAANVDPDMVMEQRADGLDITVTADRAGRKLFLPLSYSSRWRCTVNGETVELGRALAVLTAIPLEEGVNVISLTRGPARITVGLGLYCSILCAMLATAWLILRRKVKITPPRFVYTLSAWLFYAATAAAVCFIYVVPTVLLITQGTVVRF